jgi:serine/threonine-protein kinase HipA
MTLTQRTDSESGASYLELVDLLQSQGSNTRHDCIELFRRVAFSILIHNTDDHLRNHGFIIGEQGISLSPAYDLNPSNDRNELSLAINEVDTTCDVSIALEARADYGLSKSEADAVLAEVTTAVASWRKEAAELRIQKPEQDLMAARSSRDSVRSPAPVGRSVKNSKGSMKRELSSLVSQQEELLEC